MRLKPGVYSGIWVCSGIAQVLLGYCSGIAWVLLGYYLGIAWVCSGMPGYYFSIALVSLGNARVCSGVWVCSGIAWVLPGYCSGIAWVFVGYFLGISWVCLVCLGKMKNLFLLKTIWCDLSNQNFIRINNILSKNRLYTW